MPESEKERAERLYARGEYEDAVKAWEMVQELEPLCSDQWYKKGIALRKLDRYEEALEALDRALELDPKNANAWRNRAVALNSWTGVRRRCSPARRPSLQIHPAPEHG